MTLTSEAAQKIISEVKQQFWEDTQQFVLEDVRKIRQDITGSSDFREGSFGKVIDLKCGDTECVGKVLYPIFFSNGTDPTGMRCLLVKFFEEIKLLSKMDHPNIVKFLGLSYQQDSSLPMLVMEKMDCSLTQLISIREKGSISRTTVLEILLDVAKGLVYLHEDIKVAHRDLSSNNILLGPQLDAKIADLGSARVLTKPGGWDIREKLTVQPGVLDFMPPETLSSNPVYTVSVDVFSFACVVIHLCTHKWPTPDHVEKGKNVSEIERRKKYITEMGDSYLVPIVKQCLDDLSTLRPTARHVMASLLNADTVVPQTKTASNNNENIDYTIVFAGITGAGKSSAGNFFLNKKAFLSQKGLLAVTDECNASTSVICGKTVKIIDTPGFFDGFKSTEENFKELSRALTFAKDGFHAVALVMNFNRFIVTHTEALNQILNFKGIKPYLFVLLTHTENEGITKEATDKYIRECLLSPKCPQGLKNLMHEVENRVIMLESVLPLDQNYQKLKSKQLLEMVESIFKSNKNKIYNNRVLRFAAEAYELAKKHQAEKIQNIASQIQSNLEKIEKLQKENNNSAKLPINDAARTISDEMAKLREKNKDLENDLEEVKSEKYLQKMTSDNLNQIMKKSDIKAKTFSEFMRLFAIYVGASAVATSLGAGVFGTTGAIVGGGIGAVVGSVLPRVGTVVGVVGGAQIGGSLGGALGGATFLTASVTIAYDDCNQQ